MVAPIPVTKFNIPSLRPNLVSRPQLIERLEEGLRLGRRLTLVSAPAGFGKTTLVGAWLHQVGVERRVAWLALDAGENELARFLTCVVATLQQVEQGLGESLLSLLQPTQFEVSTLAPETVVTWLINDLAALPVPLILVLDDYHLLDSLEVHRAVTFLLENAPPQLHLVIISREDPMVPLHRLRAQGQLTEVRVSDLRFADAEVGLFLRQTMGLALSGDDVALLARHTEGWIASLQLAALSIQGKANVREAVEAFAGDDRHVVDYLAAEVLGRQPLPAQAFLLQTAILDRFTASLCEAVTGREDGQDMLTQLELGNLFLIPLDSKREWYRYHHLFGDFLRHFLRERMSDDEVAVLHRRAAAWYARHEMVGEAIGHSLAGGDFAEAAELIETVGEDMLALNRGRQLEAWIGALPEELIWARPYLCVTHARALGVTGRLEEARARLEDAERALSRAPAEQRGEIRGQIAIIRSYDARRQQGPEAAVGLLQQALEHLPTSSLRSRSYASANLGVNFLRLGRLQEGREALLQARAAGQASGEEWITIGAISYLAETYEIEGRLNQAARVCREAITRYLDDPKGALVQATGHAYIGLGRVLYEQDQIEEARRCLQQGLALSETLEAWNSVLRALVPLAWLEHVEGDTVTARALLERALSLAQQPAAEWGNVRWSVYVAAYQARIALGEDAAGLAAARRWAETLQDQAETAGYDFAAEIAQHTLARIDLALGRPDLAEERLVALAEGARSGGRGNDLLKVLALQSLALASRGDEEMAASVLRQALELAAPQEYRRTFLDEGPAMARLLRRSGHPYGQHLLGDPYEDEGPLPLEEPLNAREIEILRLFAAGLTNAEIAQTLFLSPNTIKWYAKSIYDKLGVNRRAKAIGRGRELGLIP